MFLKNLQLHQFKNHSDSKFIFTKPVNCFVGNNGAGKTNILDAIHYLSQTKSYFNHIDSQNIQFEQVYFMIKGTFDKDGNTSEIQCNLKEGEGKAIHKNNKKYSRFSEHIGQFPIIIISPTDTNLILEDSEVRRKYLDVSIAQYKKSYLQVLIQYKKALKQRNFLLKQFDEKGYYDEITLEVYDKQLTESGNIIYRERKDFLKQLNPVFNKYYSEISEGKERVDLEYKSQLHGNDFLTLMNEGKIKDRKSKTTQVGTHKDDVLFKMNSHPIKKTGSQGQQKSFLIALKLAQFDYYRTKFGNSPIVLLDDIFDKLDQERVRQIVQILEKKDFSQIFITDTHVDRVKDALSDSKNKEEIFDLEKLKSYD